MSDTLEEEQSPLDNESIRELKENRLTKREDTVIIIKREGGLICIPKGILLPSGGVQPISQVFFRVKSGVAYVLNKHTHKEYPIGFTDWRKDKDGQKYLIVRIPIIEF